MADGDVILTRDESSGRVHKRTVLGARLATLEECNLDQSGAYAILGPLNEVDPGDLDPKVLCRNCFPEREKVDA
jgi:hypothetical protein